MYLGSGGTQWGTSYSKRPLYAAKSETWTRPVIPTLPFPECNWASLRLCPRP